MPLKLPRLQRAVTIVGEQRTPATGFIQWWQKVCETIEQVVNDLSATIADLAAAVARLTTAEGDIDTLDADLAAHIAAPDPHPQYQTETEGDARYVRQDQTAAWADPSGALVRTTFASYAGQNVSAAYVEAEAQATDDAAKAVSQRLAALITDLRANGTLT